MNTFTKITWFVVSIVLSFYAGELREAQHSKQTTAIYKKMAIEYGCAEYESKTGLYTWKKQEPAQTTITDLVQEMRIEKKPIPKIK